MSETNDSKDKDNSNKSSGDNKLNGFEIATEIVAEYFDWNARELRALSSLKGIGEVIVKRLEAAGAVVLECYVILHDRDFREVWDEQAGDYVKVPKFEHVHVLVWFASKKKGLTVANIAKAVGIAENMIERPKPGKYSRDNMLAYRIHAKDSDKTLYDPAEVVTVRGTDYMDVWSENKKSWERGRAAKDTKLYSVELDYLLGQVIDGKVTEKQLNMDDAYYAVYSRHRKKFDEAIDTCGNRRMWHAVAAMEDGEFDTEIIFYHGARGTGKSSHAKALCRYLAENVGWSVSYLAARNSMDDYHGEEVILMDDVRGAAMTAEDWLKLLDPHGANPAAGRYRNKKRLAPRVVIITSNVEPIEFFYFAKEIGAADRNSAVNAFLRRIMKLVRVVSPEDYGCYNMRVMRPRSVEPYAYMLPKDSEGGRDEGDRTVNGIDIAFEPCLTQSGEELFLSPWHAATLLLQGIEKANHGNVNVIDGSDESLANVYACVENAFAPTPMPLPPGFDSLPVAVPECATPKKKRDLILAAEQEERIRMEAEGQAADAALIKELQEMMLDRIVEEGEFAGLTQREANQILEEREAEAEKKRMAEYVANSEAEREAAQKKAMNKALNTVKREAMKCVASLTEEEMDCCLKPQLDNVEMLGYYFVNSRSGNGSYWFNDLEEKGVTVEDYGLAVAAAYYKRRPMPKTE